MAKVFISYRRKDSPRDKQIAQIVELFLEYEKHEVWRDEESIIPGTYWPSEIYKHLGWCQVLVLLWSRSAKDSEWVQKEYQHAHANNKRIITLWLDKLELPPELQFIEAIEFHEFGKALHDLSKALRRFQEELERQDYPQGEPFPPTFKTIPAGSFRYSKTNRDESVEAFAMADFPVTIAEYRKFARNIPNAVSHDDKQPVNNVSWEDAKKYCEWLSIKTGLKIKLPSELRWEYAAKGAKNFDYATDDGEISKERANFGSYYGNETTPRETHPPNPFGLMDMSGNLWEWCDNGNDGQDEKLMDYRVVRGGSWMDDAEACRCSARRYYHRNYGNIFTGFRVMRVLS